MRLSGFLKPIREDGELEALDIGLHDSDINTVRASLRQMVSILYLRHAVHSVRCGHAGRLSQRLYTGGLNCSYIAMASNGFRERW